MLVFHVLTSLQALYLGDFGGTKIDQICRRIMDSVMVNDLAKKFNMFGRFEKTPFAGTNMMEVVYRTYL